MLQPQLFAAGTWDAAAAQQWATMAGLSPAGSYSRSSVSLSGVPGQHCLGQCWEWLRACVFFFFFLKFPYFSAQVRSNSTPCPSAGANVKAMQCSTGRRWQCLKLGLPMRARAISQMEITGLTVMFC